MCNTMYINVQGQIFISDIIELLLLGYLTNNDVSMYIANCCGEHFFVGCLDEVRVVVCINNDFVCHTHNSYSTVRKHEHLVDFIL